MSKDKKRQTILKRYLSSQKKAEDLLKKDEDDKVDAGSTSLMAEEAKSTDKTMVLEAFNDAYNANQKEFSIESIRMTQEYLADIQSKPSSGLSNIVPKKDPQTIKNAGSTMQFFSFSYNHYKCSTVHLACGKKNKVSQLQEHYIFTASSDPETNQNPVQRLKPRNLTVCITGHGKNPLPMIAALKQAVFTKLAKNLKRPMSERKGMEFLKFAMNELQKVSIDGAWDSLYSGVSVTFAFIIGDKLLYANVGANRIVLANKQAGLAQLTVLDQHVHTLENPLERERLEAAKQKHKIETVADGFQIVVRNKPLADLTFQATRCLGMMAGFPRGIKDKAGSRE